jgi:hypothetical protein
MAQGRIVLIASAKWYYYRKGNSEMNHAIMSIIVVALVLSFAGCQYLAPLSEEHSIAIDPHTRLLAFTITYGAAKMLDLLQPSVCIPKDLSSYIL